MPPKGIVGINKLSVFKDGEKIGEIDSEIATIEPLLSDCECDGFDMRSGQSISIDCKIVTPPIIRRLAGIYHRTKSKRIKKKQLVRMIKVDKGIFEFIPLKYLLQ